MNLKFTSILILVLALSQLCFGQRTGNEEDKLLSEIEVHPYLIVCKHATNQKECSEKKLSQYISKNLKYPAISRENGREGTLLLSFTVNKKGRLEKGSVLYGFDKQIKKEAEIFLKKMEQELRWGPGKLNDKEVSVIYTLPVYFSVLGKPVRKLTNIKEILCERGGTYYKFKVKKKKLKKIFTNTKRFEGYWFYKIHERELISLDIEMTFNKETEVMKDLEEITGETLDRILKCEKGTCLKIKMKENIEGEIKEIVKHINVM